MLLCLLLCLMPLAWIASAEEALPTVPGWPSGWILGLGSEFPGATGDLTVIEADGGAALRLHGDFSAGGNYVAARHVFPQPMDLETLVVRVRGAPSAFWLRLGDREGRTFQQRFLLDPSITGWQERRIREFGDPARRGIIHWGGGDGIWTGPATSIDIILHHNDLVGRTAGDIEFGPIGAACRPAVAEPPQDQETVLGDFSAGVDGWKTSLGGEFPGARATTVAEPASATGPASVRLTADFSGGGRYVGIDKSWTSAMRMTELRLRLRSSVGSVALRLTDAEGQTFQQRLALAPGGDWQDLSVRSFADPANPGIHHWGGKNDGVMRGGVRAMSLLINAPAGAGKDTVWFGRIAAVVSPGPVALAPLGAPLSFLVQVGGQARLAWKAAGPIPPSGLAFDLVDYRGDTVAVGLAEQAADGTVTCAVSPPVGFHEVVFRRNGAQRFGVICQDHPVAQPDPYFAVDAALEYFPPGNDPAGRVSYLRMLRQTGITMIRERFGWKKKQYEEVSFDFSGWKRKALRQEAADHGIGILEDFCPVWNGKVEQPLPDDIFAFRASLDRITAQLGPGWTASEFWNEPDIACTTPGDVYGAKFRAAVYHMTALFPGKPIVGGVFNSQAKQSSFETYAANGIFEHSDVFSYHDYTPAESTVETAARFRGWAAAAGRGDIPMWITEAGSGWTTGPERATIEEDSSCAWRLAWKAVDAKACGIERFFAFLLVFFEEGRTNWGMHDKRHTPMRLMGTYAAAARILAHRRYRGDLRGIDPLLAQARVFAQDGDDDAVVAVCTRSLDPYATVAFAVPVQETCGADGRLLPPRPDGRMPVPDGIGYAVVRLADLTQALASDTQAMRLCNMAAARTTVREQAPPVTLIPAVDPAQASHSVNGYFREDPAGCVMAAQVCNLSDQPMQVRFEAIVPEGVECPDGDRTIAIPANSAVPAAWTFRFIRPTPAGSPPLDLRVRAVGMPGCSWTMRFLASETAVARRNSATGPAPAPGMPEPTEGWKALGGDAYVPWGTVLYDGRTRAWARCTWEPDMLLVDVLVDKPEHQQPFLGADIWKGDSIQVALQGGGPGTAGFTEIAAALTAQGPILYRHASQAKGPGRIGPMDPSYVRIAQAGTRTLYSLRLPVAAVDLPVLTSGMSVRFALILNHHDGRSRVGYYHWGEGIAHAKAPAEYCILKLVDAPAPAR